MTKLMEVPLSKVRITGQNYRKEIDRESEGYKGLRESIAAGGILSPVLLAETEAKDVYDLVAGERRVLCATDLSLTTIPALVREQGDAASDLTAAMVENMQREDPTPTEEALGFQRLIEQGMTPQGVADALHVSLRRITDRLPILTLTPGMQEAIGAGAVPLRAVAPLAQLARCTPGIGAAVQAAILRRRGPHGPAASVTRAAAEFLSSPIQYVAMCATQEDKKIVFISSRQGITISGRERWLSKAAREYVDKMNAHVPADREYLLYRLRVPQDILSGLAQEGSGVLVFLDEDQEPRGVAFDGPQWLKENAAAIVGADYDQWREKRERASAAKNTASAKGKPTAEERAKRRAELDKQAEHVRACDAANTDLGISLMNGLASVELTKDVALFFALSCLPSPGASGGYGSSEARSRSVAKLAARGLGYVFPEWRKTEKTKNNQDRTVWPKGDDAEKQFWAWLDASDRTPQEILGRVLVAVSAAEYALPGAVPKGQRTDYNPGSFAPERKKALDRIVRNHIPASVKKLAKVAA